MSQEKTAVPGLGDVFSANPKSKLYSRSSTQVNYANNSIGTIVPSMERVAPGLKIKDSKDGNSSPVVGFLYSISRQGIGEYWPVHLGTNKIGRSEDCSIRLRENTVSDLHAELYVKQMKTTHKILASLRDVGSKNGIFVNDEELDYGTHECFNNDLITIGLNYRLLLILIDAEALGLSVSENFIAVQEEEEPEIPFQPQSTSFNPYDHNRRPITGTVAMDGSQDTEPGGTRFM